MDRQLMLYSGIDFTLIFSSAWNCSSLYVNDRVARSLSKCCQESYSICNENIKSFQKWKSRTNIKGN